MRVCAVMVASMPIFTGTPGRNRARAKRLPCPDAEVSRKQVGKATPLLRTATPGTLALIAYAAAWTAMERESGAFAHMGRLILRGGMPDVDLWAHKPPGVYLIGAVAPAVASLGLRSALGGPRTLSRLTLVALPFELRWLVIPGGATGAAS